MRTNKVRNEDKIDDEIWSAVILIFLNSHKMVNQTDKQTDRQAQVIYKQDSLQN